MTDPKLPRKLVGKVTKAEPKRQGVEGFAAAAEKNRERDARLRITEAFGRLGIWIFAWTPSRWTADCIAIDRSNPGHASAGWRLTKRLLHRNLVIGGDGGVQRVPPADVLRCPQMSSDVHKISVLRRARTSGEFPKAF